MDEVINLCTELAAYVCPLLKEEQSEHVQELLSKIMNETKNAANIK